MADVTDKSHGAISVADDKTHFAYDGRILAEDGTCVLQENGFSWILPEDATYEGLSDSTYSTSSVTDKSRSASTITDLGYSASTVTNREE